MSGVEELQAELLLDARAKLGEGPVWDHAAQLLWWVDIVGGSLHSYQPDSGEARSYDLGQEVGTVVPRASGGVMLALRDGFASFDPERGQLAMVHDPEAESGVDNRFNDGKCDPAGRFWAGTMSNKGERKAGTLWRLDADGSCHAMIEQVSISNGLCWDEDRGIFYYIDTPTYQVIAYDFDHDSGAIGNPRVAIEVPREEGGPDGMAIDAEGMLWIAHWGGHQVLRWNPDSGAITVRVRVPVAHTSACAFGGPELDRLFITTAGQGRSPEQLAAEPLTGGLFTVQVPVRGVASHAYQG